ncbi:MAG: polysaccharide biosynthesis tyrosine autokinase [Anaeromyxobacteraceae bacterium]|nr:polysaccharide biosynthesis tyrosine autokinase [Anaeromyxobacteraceae bacterium]
MPQNNEAQTYTATPEPGEELDLRAYWRVIVRRRWLILSVFAAVVLLTVLVTLRQTKVYAASTTLVIDANAPRVLDKEAVQDVVETGAGGYLSAKEYNETQYKVIASRTVAQRVVERLQLKQNDRFLGIEELDAAKKEEERSKLDPVLVLQERLKVLPVKDSRVVRIQVEDRDPQQAALLANAVAEAYIADNLSIRSTTTQSASDWLEQQLADLEGKLDQSGKALFDFKKAHDIVATTWEDRQSMVTQRLVSINDALSRARIQRAQLEARNEAVRALGDAVERDDPALESLQVIASNATIQQLKLRYLDARIECADMASRYFDQHPRKEACDGKVATSKASLRREIQATLESARNEFNEVVTTERKLHALLEQTKAEAFGVNQYERDYLELKRTYDNNQRLYEMVLKRLKDASVTGMLQMSNVRILDRAQAEEKPVSPRPVRNLALAILLGLFGGVGLAFLLEMLDTSITTREQVEERLGLPFLGIIPRIEQQVGGEELASELYVHVNPMSAPAECLRSVRANLLFMSPERPLRTILVTSSGPSEGKTTTAVSLAQIMADGGNRVLLVDADMRRPRVHTVFGISRGTGLSSLILGDGLLEDAVQPSSINNLWVLPCGPIPPNPSELLHTSNFNALLAELAARYDRVIIDSPPAGVVADAVVIATQVDGTVVIIKAGQTFRDAAARTVRALIDVKARILGAVLNDLDLEDQRYGQYYQYYRYGYYGSESREETRA